MDTFYQRAYSLISSQKAREAFNINAEPAKIRDEYGRNAAGQRHADGPPAGRRRRPVRHRRLRRLGLPLPDRHRHAEPDAAVRPGVRRPDPRPRPHRPAQADARHGLQRVRPHARRSTRTPAATTGPRSSASSWPAAASRRGYIHGASNATATEPERDPIGPEDLATTVYHQLGIVADKELMAPGNRPIEIVDGGKVLKELLA